MPDLCPDLCLDASALVFDIQRFCLHDGPGIRTVVFFKGCLLACAWCQNPESKKQGPEIAFYEEACRGCFACRESCPEACIVEGPHTRIDRSRCTPCGACARACVNDALRLVGRHMTEDALMEELLKDRDFYEDSGGGVTVSGGEPLLQAAFLEGLMARLQDEGIHVLVETAGLFATGDIDRVFPLADQVYFDLKHMDPADHKRLTGRENFIILEHFAVLSRRFGNVQARLPVIPGVNDTPSNIRATAAFLTSLGHGSIHLLPYHSFGDAKRKRLGQTPGAMKAINPDTAACRQAAALFESEGIHAVVYD